MLQKRVSVCLLALLLCHTLASVIVGVVGWWQAENELSKQLLVYRSVDSIVEFQIPLKDLTDGKAIARTTEDGFRHRGHDYNVVSLEVKGDKILIAGIEAASRSFWQDDLLAFLNDHLKTSSDTGRKASQLLKFLLKEYSPSSATVLPYLCASCSQSVKIADASFTFSTRSAPIHAPPPEQAV